MPRRYGVDRMNKSHVAEHLGCGMGTVNYHWKTIVSVTYDAVVAHALRRGDTVLLMGTLTRR